MTKKEIVKAASAWIIKTWKGFTPNFQKFLIAAAVIAVLATVSKCVG